MNIDPTVAIQLSQTIKSLWESGEKDALCRLLADHLRSHGPKNSCIVIVACVRVGILIGEAKSGDDLIKKLQEFDPGEGFQMIRP